MRSYACFFVVFVFVLSSPVLSEESVFPDQSTAQSQTGEISAEVRPTCSDLTDPINPLSREVCNLYFYPAPVTNPVIATFSFLDELDMYDLTASSSDGGSVSPGSVSVPSGGSQTFTATPDAGYAVDKWYLFNAEAQEGGTTYTVSDVQADQRIHVTFKKAEYTITATAGPNGSIRPTLSIISPGGDEQYIAIPNIGYKVDKWYLDGNVEKAGGTTFALSDIYTDHTVHVTFRQALAYSLDDIEFEDEEEFEERIINNNTDPAEPDKAMVLIERTEGVGPEPDNVVMRMRSQKDLDPTSPNYGKLVNARAKGIFIKTDADKILIRFKYLFLTSDPDVKIVVYLSDSPELLAPDDPLRQQHYIECAQIPNPPFPRPGAAGTDRFAIFQKIVWTGHLNFTEGLYIELELIEPDTSGLLFASSLPRVSADSGGSSVFIDDWSPAVQCYGICMDINWDNFVDEADFLMVIGGTGCDATGENACLDGALSGDGGVDSFDVVSWDWALNSDERLLNFCGVPLASGGGSVSMMSTAATGLKSSAAPPPRVNLAGSDLSDLLIAGKTSELNPSSKLKDSLYVFNNEGQFSGSFVPASDRCNIKLVKGPGGEVYQLNSETGILRLDSSDTAIIPPGEIRLSNITEPRYNSSATVYVGIQDKGADSFGRPILDAAFDAEYVYVVPVVVNPDGEDPYTAAAKLRLLDGASPPYEVVQLYDDPPLPNDNQYRNYLRELEIDNAGNLYVLNVHAINESDILWRYKLDGTVERIDLGRPDSDSYVPAPVAMYMSKTTDMLYLTSAAYNPADPDSTVVYGFSTNGSVSLERTVTIIDLQHITGITEDPQTGTLWVAGFNMYDIPLYPNPFQMAFYYPFLAKIPNGGDNVEVLPLYDPDSHDLALPMSILWTRSAGHD
jgi:hypothetical protein